MPALSKFDWVESFTDAERALGDRDSKVIGNNTTLERRGPQTIAVRLHNTFVVTFHASGRIGLNSGGYRTVTTKDRLNRYTPKFVRIYQEDFDWFVDIGDETLRFEDGMVIDPNKRTQTGRSDGIFDTYRG